MIVLVVYDIASDRRRQAVSSRLEGVGMRVQLSIFECELENRRALDDLLGDLAQLVDDDEDQIRVYVLRDDGHDADALPLHIVGARVLETRRDWWII